MQLLLLLFLNQRELSYSSSLRENVSHEEPIYDRAVSKFGSSLLRFRGIRIKNVASLSLKRFATGPNWEERVTISEHL